jgi:DNA repair protein RadC
MNSTYTILVRDNSVGSVREATADEIITAARQALARRVRRGTELSSPKLTSDYLRMRLSTREHEIFVALYLDNRHRVIEYTELFRGTIDGANVYPREVVKEALRHNASAVILAHNHPSGVVEPSQADQLITLRLREALALIDIRVLDHLVVAGDEVVSFAERGLL